MIKRKLILFIAGLVALLPTLACGSAGVYDPQATQTAMEATVTALQATIVALEANTSQSRQQADERVVVVTTTSTPIPPKPAGSATVIPASSLGQTIQLTSTPTPTPINITAQDRVVTVVATFTPTPTPEQHTDSPIIIDPAPGTVVEEGREILLHWGFNGLLQPDEYFDVKIKPDGQNRSAYVGWERGLSHKLVANLAPGRYYWSVQVLKGYYKNNSGEPEDRVFEAFTSPESAPRLIIVAEKRKPRTPTPTRRPDLNNNSTPDSDTNSTEETEGTSPDSGDSSNTTPPSTDGGSDSNSQPDNQGDTSQDSPDTSNDNPVNN